MFSSVRFCLPKRLLDNHSIYFKSPLLGASNPSLGDCGTKTTGSILDRFAARTTAWRNPMPRRRNGNPGTLPPGTRSEGQWSLWQNQLVTIPLAIPMRIWTPCTVCTHNSMTLNHQLSSTKCHAYATDDTAFALRTNRRVPSTSAILA